MRCLLLVAIATSPFTAAIAQPAPAAAVQQIRTQPPAPTRSGDRVDLPIKMIDGLPTVSVQINGNGPYQVGIDTGAAGYLRVTPELAKMLKLDPIGEALASDPSGKNPSRVRLFQVASLKLGGIDFSKVPTIALSTTRIGIQGVLGISFFRDLLLTLDYGASRLRVGPGALPPADGKTIVDISLDRGVLPSVPLSIGSWSGPAHLDTGNTRFPLFVPADQVAAIPRKGASRDLGTARTVSQEMKIEAADLAAPVLVGTTKLAVSRVGYPSAGPIANIGSLALTGISVTLDIANRRAGLVPSGSPQY